MANKIIEYNGVRHSIPDNWTDDQKAEFFQRVDLEQGKNQAGPADVIPKLQGAIHTTPSVDTSKPFISQVGEGIWETAKTLPGMAHEILKRPQGKFEENMSWNPLAVLLKRSLWDPSQASWEKEADLNKLAEEHEKLGVNTDDPIVGLRHQANKAGIGGTVPIFGPIADYITDPMVQPNGYGRAIGRGLGAEAVPRAGTKLIKKGYKTGRKLVYPNEKAMRTTPAQGGVNPVESFTPEEIQNYAKVEGIPMTAAEVTESGPLRAIQGVGEKSAFGSGKLKKHKAVAQKNVYRTMDNLGEQTGTPRADNVQISRSMKAKVEKARTEAKKKVDQDYANWRAGQKDAISLDLTDVNKKYGDLLDQNNPIYDNIPNSQAATLRGLLEKAKEFGMKTVKEGEKIVDPVIDLEMAKELRSHWIDARRDIIRRTGRADSREAALAGQIVSDLDQAMERSIRQSGEKNVQLGQTLEEAGQGAVDTWRKANESQKRYVEDFYGDDSILRDILESGETDANALVDKILGSKGGNRVHVEQLRNAGVDVGELQRAVMDRIEQSGFNNARMRLGGFSDDFMQSLFADKPELLNNLYKTSKVARATNVDSNPSNSGGTLSATGDLEATAAASILAPTNPGLAVGLLAHVPGVKYLAAKLSTSDWFNRWQTNVPNKGNRVFQLDKKAGEYYQNAGGTDLPPEPPSGGGGTGSVAPESGKPSSKLRKQEGGAAGGRPVQQAYADVALEEGAAGDTGFDFGANVKASSKLERRKMPSERDAMHDMVLAELRKALKEETDPAKKAEIQAAITRELDMKAGIETKNLSGPKLNSDGSIDWGSQYKGAASKLTKNNEGGANYTADELAAFKKKNGIKDDVNLDKAEKDLTERMKKLPDEWADEGIDPDRFLEPDKSGLAEAVKRFNEKFKRGVGPDELKAWVAAGEPDAWVKPKPYPGQKLKKKVKDRLSDIEPEGPRKPGTGPGAMLRRGSKLVEPAKSGPSTGDTAKPVLQKQIREHGSKEYLGWEKGDADAEGNFGGYLEPGDVTEFGYYDAPEAVDPRKLTPSQTYINPSIVNRYMDDPSAGGDVFPLVAQDSADPSRQVIINGHHRAVAAIKSGRDLHVEPWREELLDPTQRTFQEEIKAEIQHLADELGLTFEQAVRAIKQAENGGRLTYSSEANPHASMGRKASAASKLKRE